MKGSTKIFIVVSIVAFGSAGTILHFNQDQGTTPEKDKPETLMGERTDLKSKALAMNVVRTAERERMFSEDFEVPASTNLTVDTARDRLLMETASPGLESGEEKWFVKHQNLQSEQDPETGETSYRGKVMKRYLPSENSIQYRIQFSAEGSETPSEPDLTGKSRFGPGEKVSIIRQPPYEDRNQRPTVEFK
ncbi:MAG: hypothetical protein ABEJ03_01695 [Candidatus Nanohaloarchaea archaeon]